MNSGDIRRQNRALIEEIDSMEEKLRRIEEAARRWSACVDRGGVSRDVLVCVEDVARILRGEQ